MSLLGQFGSRIGACGIAVWAILYLPSLANAAWLGYRNDTQAPVVIQSAIVVNNQIRWGKPHTLFPGEVAQDAVPAPGTRVVAVFDPKQNNRLIYQENVTVGIVDIVLSLRMVTPPQPAAPRFVVISPVMPQPAPGSPRPTPPQPITPGNPPKPPSLPSKPPANPPGKSGGSKS